MKSTIKPFSVEITKKDGFKYINDAVGYFPKEWTEHKMVSIREIIKKHAAIDNSDWCDLYPSIKDYDFDKLERELKKFMKEWLFVVERVDGSRYLCNRDDIVDILIYGEENE